MLVNPLTRQVLNANPKGDNQYSNPDGPSRPRPIKDKFYKTLRSTESKRLAKRIVEGPFDSQDEAAAHEYLADRGIDASASDLTRGFLMRKGGKFVPISKGKYILEDWESAENDFFQDENDDGEPIRRRYRLVKPKPIPEKYSGMIEKVLEDIRTRRKN